MNKELIQACAANAKMARQCAQTYRDMAARYPGEAKWPAEVKRLEDDEKWWLGRIDMYKMEGKAQA